MLTQENIDERNALARELREARRIVREVSEVRDCAFSMCWGPGKKDEGMTHCSTCLVVRRARRFLRGLPREE
jgi:hypothetical protein